MQHLQRLTLREVAGLSGEMVTQLMGAPALRLLQLLACMGAPSSEQCYVMSGVLDRHQLQVEVVEEGQSLLGSRLVTQCFAKWKSA